MQAFSSRRTFYLNLVTKAARHTGRAQAAAMEVQGASY
ncbi:hypothetical protein PpBr36_01264 [Pyricularia pennisetigena]|nr:hypothetical protein PpBr36_01264 [Pyricularia pennisetigena]TLS29816.1 hypothetical protein PpBr36_01264 [Pyricularia pennisetigena]